MALLNLTQNLTRIASDDLSRQIRKTHVGMAHFTGSGPAGARCRQCMFWRDAELAARPEMMREKLKPATCRKFTHLTNKQGQKVPAAASACKYFEAFRP